MKIILVHKAEFQKRPPVISSLLILSDLGYELILVTEDITDYWRCELHNRGIKIEVIPNRYKGKWGKIGKILSYFNFRNSFKRVINKYFTGKGNELLWVEGAQTLVALGKLIQKHKYILQIQELHENSKMQLKSISYVIHQAECVFMPEYNRTMLYKLWFKLKKSPIVLPNKAYFFPDENVLQSVEQDYKEIVTKMKDKKIILYQGYIGKDRDLTGLVKAVKALGDDFILLLLGNDCSGLVNEYRIINPNLIHIEYIPAPYYLFFTSISYIGVLSYNDDVLNNIYCAPNKIYEYSKYALPMLGNNIPGLKYTIEINSAGKIIDFEDSEEIIKALNEISANYELYSLNSFKIFDSLDNQEIIDIALKKIKF